MRMKIILQPLIATVLGIIFTLVPINVRAEEQFHQVLKPRQYTFPKDHGDHPGYRIEWWYYTGNLTGENKKRFGFQLTFFRVQLKPIAAVTVSPWRTNDLFFAHFALTDMEQEKFYFSEKRGRDGPDISGVTFDGKQVRVFLFDWEAIINGDIHQLKATSDHYGIDLKLISSKPAVFHGEKGFSEKGLAPGAASYYYSLTRLESQGHVTINKEKFVVSGLGWMDHEFSSTLLSEERSGWDWISLQFLDGTELMLYTLRHKEDSNKSFSKGTWIGPDGTYNHLSKEDFIVKILDYWKSPKTGATYPSLWQVDIVPQKMHLKITPNIENQELVTTKSTWVTYWEGSVAVTGIVNGRQAVGSGYVELTGYGESFRPAWLW